MVKINHFSSLAGKTFLITGAAGMLGGAFADILRRECPTAKILAKSKAELDVTDSAAVLALKNQPLDYIIHCAADVNADRCEENPEQCHAIQVGGTENIVALAKVTGAKVFYPQSFLIFDGKTSPIDETTEPAPLSVYGHCKLQAEEVVRTQLPESLVVRMAGFFGGGEVDKNFVGKFTRHMAKIIAAGESSYAVGDRVWQPTFTYDLAYNCLALLAANKQGIYTMACEGEASFFDLACACIELLGLQEKMCITPAASSVIASQDKAVRPACAVMSTAKLRAEGIYHQRHWRDALAEYLAQPYFQHLFAQSLSPSVATRNDNHVA